MKKTVFAVLSLACAAALTACQASPLRPEAQKIRITNSEPTNCRYLGEVTGNQGNFFSGGWTSNENLEVGARNEMKNKASEMGGNVIVMLSNRAGQTGSYGLYGGHSQQTNVTYTGTVYRCGSVGSNGPTAKKSSKQKS